MKTRFIKINDVSEIETSKATVYDLNNRYIDGKGNMYGLRYNKDNKKIEIIKIIRTPAKTAPYYHQKLVLQKRLKASEPAPETEDADGPEPAEDRLIREEEIGFNPDTLITTILDQLKTHRDRLSGIVMNIRNSKIITESDRMDYATMNQLFKNIDIDGVRRIDKVIDNHRELVNYPRSLSYYQAKLDIAGRNMFDALDSDARKMKFIYYHEMYSSLKNLYRAMGKSLQDIDFFLSDKKLENKKNIGYIEKQNYQDAILSITNTLREIGGVLRDLKVMEVFLQNPDNF